MTKTNTKAFTLIELLIVIVIIGILAVALIPRLTGAQASARDAARQAGVQQVVTALNVQKNETPATTITATADLVTQGYLQSNPTDPKSELPFTISGDGTAGYSVCAVMERPVKGNSAETDCTTVTTGTSVATSGPTYFVVVK